MAVKHGIEQRGTRPGGDASHEPEAVEQLERRVHGRHSKRGQAVARRVQKLVSGHVTPELVQRSQEHESLRRRTLASVAQRVPQFCVCHPYILGVPTSY